MINSLKQSRTEKFTTKKFTFSEVPVIFKMGPLEEDEEIYGVIRENDYAEKLKQDKINLGEAFKIPKPIFRRQKSGSSSSSSNQSLNNQRLIQRGRPTLRTLLSQNLRFLGFTPHMNVRKK